MGNVATLGIDEVIKRLKRDIAIESPMDALSPKNNKVRGYQPIKFFKRIPDASGGTAETDLNDPLEVMKRVAIYDQLNTKNIPCRYCKLPYSLRASWQVEAAIDHGLIAYEDNKKNPQNCCLFCGQIDFDGTDIYHAFSYIFGRSTDSSYKREIEKAGTDHAFIGLFTSGDFKDHYFIENYILIRNTTSVDELKRLLAKTADKTQKGLDEFF